MLVDKKEHKFEMDRDSWCTYQNFCKTYEMIEEKLVGANVAVQLESPVWKTGEDEIVGNNEIERAFGCKCKIQITHPEMVILADEVGCNTSQRGDDLSILGVRHLCVQKEKHLKKSSKKDNYFTLLGFTLLTGDPLMCN